MSDTVSEYVHTFPSFGVYPRVHYFQRRFRDLLPRYTRVTAALPKCFTNKDLRLDLEQLKDDFDYGIDVHVIGKQDLEETDIVFCPLPSRRKSETTVHTPSISVFICHAYVENLDKNGIEDVDAVMKVVGSKLTRSDFENTVLVRCNVNKHYSEDETAAFRTAITKNLNRDQKGFDIAQRNIVITSDTRSLKEKISDALENKLVAGLFRIISHLRLFECIKCESENVDVLKTEAVVTSIEEFLRNAHNRIDMPLEEGTDEAACERVLELALQSVCRVTKCSIVSPLGKKFGLQTWICNRLMHELKFEEALVDSISKNTRHHCKKIADLTVAGMKSTTKNTKKCYRFDFICLSLTKDMGPVVNEVEKKMASMKRLSTVIQKMAFEIHGYLKQTHIDMSSNTIPQMAKISKELRQEILGIPGVYGLGLLYGQLEVHLDRDLVKDGTDSESVTDRTLSFSKSKDKEETDALFFEKNDCKDATGSNDLTGLLDVKLDIASKLRKHRFNDAYTVKFIQKKPTVMGVNLEPGDKLLRRGTEKEGFLFGTLGGFVMTMDRKLHGLTCGHVVGQEKQIFIDKGKHEPFSNCSKVVQTGEGILKLIDIAALEVLPNLQESCIKSLASNVKSVEKATLSAKKPEELVGNDVYKFGAATGKTEGLIISVDYSVFGTNAEEYLFIIDIPADKPDDFTENFSPLTMKEKQHLPESMESMTNESSEGTLHYGQIEASNEILCRNETGILNCRQNGSSQEGEQYDSGVLGNMVANTDERDASIKQLSKSNPAEPYMLLPGNRHSEIGEESWLLVSGLYLDEKEGMDGTKNQLLTRQKHRANKKMKILSEETIPISHERNTDGATSNSENEKAKADATHTERLISNTVSDNSSEKDNVCDSGKQKPRTDEKNWLNVNEASCDGEKHENMSGNIQIMRQEDIEDKQGWLSNEAMLNNLLLYVKDRYCCAVETDEQERSCKVFAQEGDSGSIVCTPDLLYDGLSSLAVSMISAGNFKIEGHEGMKCVSFKLSEGLLKLKEQHNLEFMGSC